MIEEKEGMRLGEMRKGRRERIEKGSREIIENERKERKEKVKRELRRQFEEEEGLKEINSFTWTSNTRKSQVHFMMRPFV